MSAFDDDDVMAEETTVTLDQVDSAPSDDTIDMDEDSGLSDFNFGGEDDMPFTDEEE